MKRLYRWVDSNPPSPERRFSPRRVTKLFVAIMISSILAGLPLALWQLGLLSFKNAQEQRQRQEHLQKGWNELEKAAREGNTGEATKRLFGIEAPRHEQPKAREEKQ